jgi:Orsellinic acid/F9775 biosynthesis cluster protein D
VLECVEELFGYLATHSLLICKPCGIGVLVQCLNIHLDTAHCYNSKFHREIEEVISQQFPGALGHEGDVSQLDFPDSISAPFPLLPVYYDGLRCQGTEPQTSDRCTYVCRSLSAIQKHCYQKHGWINPRKRGRISTALSAQC